MKKPKLIRTATVSLSLDILIKGQLHFLNKYYQVIAISGGDATLQKVASREQVQVIPIAMQRQIAPFKDLVSLWKLYQCFKKEKPQIVHSITPKAGLLSMVAAYFAKVPIRIHTFTGLIFPSKKGLMQHLLITMDRLLCKFATHIYPEGVGVKNDLIRYNITSKPLKVLANGNVNGIDTSHFNPKLFANTQNEALKKQLGIATNDFVFIFVGRLVGDKGINELVKAFKELEVNRQQAIGNRQLEIVQNSKLQTPNSKLQTKYSKLQTPNSKLLLVGPLETALDPLLPETLQEISSNPNIIAVGYQEDVRPYFAISNVLVFPSYREGFPNVVLQAGAMGLPSIVTNINGCNEIISEGANGWIIPVKNTVAIKTAMEQVLQNNNTYTKIASNARRMIQTRFEQQVVWEAILEEYRLLERRET